MKRFLAIAWLMILACTALGATRYVDINNGSPSSPFTSWATAATNIQDAFGVAGNGDSIVIGEGIHEITNSLPFDTIDVTVYSSNNLPHTTEIKTMGSPPPIWLTDMDNGDVIYGFSFTGLVGDNSVYTNADPIYLYGNPVISNCVFKNNGPTNTDWSAGNSWYIYLYNGDTNTALITDCYFTSNNLKGPLLGGSGGFNVASQTRFLNNTISYNNFPAGFVNLRAEGKDRFKNNHIHNNTFSNGSLVLSSMIDCTFENNNISIGNGSDVGWLSFEERWLGIDLYPGPHHVSNVVIRGNTISNIVMDSEDVFANFTYRTTTSGISRLIMESNTFYNISGATLSPSSPMVYRNFKVNHNKFLGDRWGVRSAKGLNFTTGAGGSSIYDSEFNYNEFTAKGNPGMVNIGIYARLLNNYYNCVWKNNYQDANGLTNTLLLLYGVALSGSGHSLNNCTMANNTNFYVDTNYRLFSLDSGVMTVNNSILWNNKASNGGNLLAAIAPKYTNSIIQGVTPSATVYNDDPLFVDPDNGDFRLKATSPAINAGGNESVSTEVDLLGNPRIQGGTVDLGAYEYFETPLVLPYGDLGVFYNELKTAFPIKSKASIDRVNVNLNIFPTNESGLIQGELWRDGDIIKVKE